MSSASPVSTPQSPIASIETSTSWLVLVGAVAIMAICYGAPLITVVGLKPIADELGSARSVPALAYSLAWFGMAVGGLAMGPIAERMGVRWTVLFGATMICIGLVVSTLGGSWAMYIGHGVLIGLIGNAGLNAPLYVYVTRWFDRRRGTALAIIASGQYIAGVIWPSIFERAIGEIGWRRTMIYFGCLQLVLAVPLALFVLRNQPVGPKGYAAPSEARPGSRVLGLDPNLALALIAIAAFCCCIPMAMPTGHLVAFCTDLGLAPAKGAAMLSLLLGTALISRQFWGWLSDRIGGLRTILAGTICQALATAGLLVTHDETGVILVTTAFGIGFSGIIPAYILTVRALFPSSEASWRVPVFLLSSGSGMAAGGWLGGVLYDYFGFYSAAFAIGLGFNVLNILIIGALVARLPRAPRPRTEAAPADGITASR